MELLTEVERIKSIMGLILEKKKKLTRDNKFFWISENMGEWLYYEVWSRDYDMNNLPFFDMYKIYLISKTNVNTSNRTSIAESFMNHYEDFLNVMEPQKSEDVIDEIKRHFPSIAQKIARYERKEYNPDEKRGRNKLVKAPKITSAIKSGRFSGDISKLKPLSSVRLDSVNVPEPEVKPKVDGRGRRPVGGEFTTQERFKFKTQGLEYINHLEDKFKEYDNLASTYIQRAQEKLEDINRRKRFFGIK